MPRLLTARTAALAAAATLTLGLVMIAPSYGASSSRDAVGDSVPTWATAANARGLMPTSERIATRVYLASRDPQGLVAYARAVSQPGDPLYHHYLSPTASLGRFGSAPGAASKVAAWLRASGLTVTGSNDNYVSASGTVGQAESTFGVALHTYTVDGKTVHAPNTSVTVPSAVASDVLTVTGLSSQVGTITPMMAGRPELATPSAKSFPCSSYFGQKLAKQYPSAYGRTQPFAVCGYHAAQLRGAYGVTKSKLSGKGITVAVVDAFALPTMEKDVNRWAKRQGEAPLKLGQLTQYVPAGTPDRNGWAGEEALDIESIKSMAPDANISYVAAKSAHTLGDFLDPLQKIVRYDLGDAVNDSWELSTDAGMDPSWIAAYEKTFQMGATEGIGFYFSSGDGGGLSGSGQPYVLWPGSDPWVTSVGGSAIGINANNSYAWETSWETDYTTLSKSGKHWTPELPGVYQSGAGGGTSVVFAQPWYQRHVVPGKFSKVAGGAAMRVIPDIGAVADPTTGFLEAYSVLQKDGSYVYEQGRIGGTSLSSPLIVGMQADAEQAQGGVKIGFANPSIYARYGTLAYHDVTDTPFGRGITMASVRTLAEHGQNVPALASLGQARDAGLASIPGYDTTTGVGTPDANYFASFRPGR